MLKVGDLAPDFEIPSVRDAEAERLSDWLQSGPVIVYFYPMDFTPVCTREACLFRDAYEELAEQGLRVVGINAMSQTTHDRFRRRHELPFPLVADTEKRIIKEYGALGAFGLMTRRVSYLVGRDGRVVDVARGDFRLEPHRDFVERALDEAKKS